MSVKEHRWDTIRVRNLEVDCIVGVYPEEREQLQPLIIDIEVDLDTREAAHDETIRHTVDYARLTREISFVLENARFQLLETAAEALARTVLSAFEATQAVRVTLEKPSALPGPTRPSLSIRRHRDTRTLLNLPFGNLDMPWAGRSTSIHRVRLRPGGGVELNAAADFMAVLAEQAGRTGEPTSARRLVNQTEETLGYLVLSRPPLRADAFVAIEEL